jgi:hypothetical protein
MATDRDPPLHTERLRELCEIKKRGKEVRGRDGFRTLNV